MRCFGGLACFGCTVALLGACSHDASDPDSNAAGASGASAIAGNGAAAGANASGGSAGASVAGSSQQGGTGGLAGHAGSSVGGSSGGDANKARGAVSLAIEVPAGCSLGAQTLDVPPVPGGHPVTADDQSGVIADGAMTQDGKPVKVVCRWRMSTSGLAFDATIAMGTGASQTSIMLGAEGLAEGQPGKGDVVVDGPGFPASYGAPVDGCTFEVKQLDATAHAVWGSLSCPIFDEPDSGDTCAIGTSYFAFEKCAL